MEGNEYERKYKQLNMLGKGNYGTIFPTQARFTRSNSTTARKESRPSISLPRKCSLKDSRKTKSNQPLVKYPTSNAYRNPRENQQGNQFLGDTLRRPISRIFPHRELTNHHHGAMRVYFVGYAAGDLSSFLKGLKKNQQRLT